MLARLIWQTMDSGAGKTSTLSGVKVSLWHPIIVIVYQSWTLLGSSVEDRRRTDLASRSSPEGSCLSFEPQGGAREGGSVAHPVAVPELL